MTDRPARRIVFVAVAALAIVLALFLQAEPVSDSGDTDETSLGCREAAPDGVRSRRASADGSAPEDRSKDDEPPGQTAPEPGDDTEYGDETDPDDTDALQVLTVNRGDAAASNWDWKGLVEQIPLPTDLDPDRIVDMAWSPDGRHLAVLTEQHTLHMVTAGITSEVGGLDLLCERPAASEPVWHPENILLFTVDCPGQDPRIYLIEPGASPTQLLRPNLAPGGIYRPSVDPAGHTVSFQQVGTRQLYTWSRRTDAITRWEHTPRGEVYLTSDNRAYARDGVAIGLLTPSTRVAVQPIGRVALLVGIVGGQPALLLQNGTASVPALDHPAFAGERSVSALSADPRGRGVVAALTDAPGVLLLGDTQGGIGQLDTAYERIRRAAVVFRQTAQLAIVADGALWLGEAQQAP